MYLFLNFCLREKVDLDTLNINGIEYTLIKEDKFNNFEKLEYSAEDNKITIYKKVGWIPLKGKPFSQEALDLYKSIENENKKIAVLSDYYHHVFIVESSKNKKNDIDKMFNDYSSLIYCTTKKNIEYHPNYFLNAKKIKNVCPNG